MRQRNPTGGTPHQRSDGRWQAIVELERGSHGKRQRKYAYGSTAKEAASRAADLRARVARGESASQPRIKVCEFAEDYLDLKKSTVKARTHQRYTQLLHCHVLPMFGNKALASLTPHDLQRLYADLSKHRSPQTVRHVHRVMHNLLKLAVEWDLVLTNVAERAHPPRVPRREMSILDAEQTAQLVAAASRVRLGVLFVAAVYTGARQGELLALPWSNVDLSEGYVAITRTLVKSPRGGFHYEEPKTSRSRRRIELSEGLCATLRSHRATQHRERLQAGDAWHDEGLVFCREDGTPIDGTRLLRETFYPLLEQAGLPRIRFHDLRHSAASLLLREGVHPKIVSEMLGHSSVAITLDTYSHALPTMQREAAATMDRVIKSEADGA